MWCTDITPEISSFFFKKEKLKSEIKKCTFLVTQHPLYRLTSSSRPNQPAHGHRSIHWFSFTSKACKTTLSTSNSLYEVRIANIVQWVWGTHTLVNLGPVSIGSSAFLFWYLAQYVGTDLLERTTWIINWK